MAVLEEAQLSITSLPKTVDAETAAGLVAKREKRRSYPFLRHLSARNPTPCSLELVYAPHYYLEYAGGKVDKKGSLIRCAYLADAGLGVVEICPIAPPVVTIDAPASAVLPAVVGPELARPVAQAHARQYILRHTGSVDLALVGEQVIHLPYWLVYYRLAGGGIDFQVFEAFGQGRLADRKAKQAIGVMLAKPKAGCLPT